MDASGVDRSVPLGHVGLTVPDLDAAVRWYQRVFGWRLLMGPVEVTSEDPKLAAQLEDVFDRPDISFRQAHLALPGGIALELFEFLRPETHGQGAFNFSSVGVSHLCLVVPDIDAAAARIEAEGGRRRTKIRPIFEGEPYRFCYCEDPFGNAIELATHPHWESFGGRRSY